MRLLGAHGYPADWPQLEEFVARMSKMKTAEEIHRLVLRQIEAIRESYPRLVANLHADEKQKILIALEECAYNQSEACKALGISRGTLRNKMLKHGIKFPNRREVLKKL